MSVSSEVRKAGPYNGNGVATSFAFAFKVFAATDLVVVHTDADGVETDLDISIDYSVTLNADQEGSPGGVVTYPLSGAALPALEKLTLTSAVPYLQKLDLTNQGGFYPTVLNAALDRVTILVQQLAEQSGRSVRVPISDPRTPDDYWQALFIAADASADAAAISATQAAASESGAGTLAANAAGSAVAADESRILAAANAASVDTQNLATGYYNATEPLVKWPGMIWNDAGNLLRRQRNAANSAWVTIGPLFEEMALKVGDPTQTFSVAVASADSHAINRGQANAAYAPLVPDGPWITPAYTAAAQGASANPLRYKRLASGLVLLMGGIQINTASTTAFTLPGNMLPDTVGGNPLALGNPAVQLFFVYAAGQVSFLATGSYTVNNVFLAL